VVTARSIQNDSLIDGFRVENGTVGVPTAPGLGIRVTPEMLAKYRFVPKSGERT